MPERPVWHEVYNGGYGDERDGESWCDACGWSTENDMFANEALRHAVKENAAFWAWVLDMLDESVAMLRLFYEEGAPGRIGKAILGEWLEGMSEFGRAAQ